MSDLDANGIDVRVGAVFAAALDAVIVMDAGGIVRRWNRSAEEMFGRSEDEAVGNTVAELIIPGPLRATHAEGLRRYLETGEARIIGRRIELTALHAEGTEFPVELTVTGIPGAEPPQFVAFLRDLRERQRTAQENLRLQQRMTFLAQAGLVLDRSMELPAQLRSLVDLTVPGLAQLTAIHVLEDDAVVRTAVAAAENPEHARAVEQFRAEHPLTPGGSEPVAEVLRTGQPMLLPTLTPNLLFEATNGSTG